MILIVGGAGYIGSHINKLLHEKGYDTVVYDNLVYGHREFVKWGHFEQGDLCDKEHLRKIFAKYEIEAVMHFAAYAYVGESVIEPAKYYNNNVCNTIFLLDVMREYNVKNIVFSSSCATYGIPQNNPIVEEEYQNPINPYGWSKLMVEKILKSYSDAYGMKYACLRYFNAAGADSNGELGEWHIPETHVIPLLLDTAAGKRDVFKVYGTSYDTRDGSCIRDYIHVSDLADAHFRALNYLKKEEKSLEVNLGTGIGVSVLELVSCVQKICGKKLNVEIAEKREGDPPVLIGSGKKAEALLGWKPKYTNIEEILEHAWHWYQYLEKAGEEHEKL